VERRIGTAAFPGSKNKEEGKQQTKIGKIVEKVSRDQLQMGQKPGFQSSRFSGLRKWSRSV
jgi:hypothetical protein